METLIIITLISVSVMAVANIISLIVNLGIRKYLKNLEEESVKRSRNRINEIDKELKKLEG